jgi:beta-galactosidase GanA
MNTVLVPVYWELIEPSEGKFDFSSVTGMIQQARQRNLRVVLLWFGSWKNSMSSYVPAWIKRDAVRFPRAEVANKDGGTHTIEALSAFSADARAADMRAFAALMKYLRQNDGTRHTVLMVQVENEVAMVEEPADRSAAAQSAFAAPVPRDLIDYLIAHRSSLAGALAQAWTGRGARESGSWADVFGAGAATEELFIAWHFARYVDAVARAGKAEYPLPMFVNAALNRPGAKPGQYPSGGPLPHLFDIWRAATPTIDLLCPDIYFPNFADWTGRYARPDNTLFVPEARNEADSGVNALYAVGAHQALGFSPFSVESIENPGASTLAQSYRVLEQIAPLVLAASAQAGKGAGTMTAVLLDKENPSREIQLGGYRVRLVHDYTWEWSGPARLAPNWPRAGAVIINTAPGNYLLAGSGVIATFVSESPNRASGIERIEEGSYEGNKWIVGRRLNGDESHQGRHLRLPMGPFGIQRIWLYQSQ